MINIKLQPLKKRGGLVLIKFILSVRFIKVTNVIHFEKSAKNRFTTESFSAGHFKNKYLFDYKADIISSLKSSTFW